jgi:hypothetical protein
VSVARVVVGGVGVLLGAYGAWLLISRQDLHQIASAVAWLVAGVVLHDGVVVPVTLVLGLLAARWLSPAHRPAATVALVVVGPLTLLAIPVLGRFGARPDNATLLDRPYLAAWAGLLAVAVAAVAVAGRVVRSRHGTATEDPGAGPGEDADGTGAGRR